MSSIRHSSARRVVGLVAALMALVGAACAPTASPPPPTIGPGHGPHGDGPNIVMILVDDLDASTTPYWEAMPRTRELIADRGMTFTNALSPTPICCPARASLLTGQYGHNTDVVTNGGEHGGWASFVDDGGESRTFPIRLQQAGYRTMLAGKYMNGYDHQTIVPPGWSEWYATADNLAYLGYGYELNENGTLVRYGAAEDDYLTDVLARKTVSFVERSEADDDRPFFAYIAPTAPHLPLPPARRHANHPWTTDVAPRSPSYAEPDLTDKPSWLQLSGDARNALMPFNDTDHRNRMGSLLAVDDLVVAILDALDRADELDDTVLVFTSDNGYNLGAHRLVHKMAPYEESIRIPLSIAGPGIVAGTEDALVAQVDLAPTLLELAGAPELDTVDGASLVPFLGGTPPPSWRHDVVLQYLGGQAANGIGAELPPGLIYGVTVLALGQEIPTYRALRTETHLFVEWYGDDLGGFHEFELYDLRADPYQLDNLLATKPGRDANAALVAQLTERLDELSTCAAATCRPG